MSTVDRPPGRRTLPPLAAGQRLDQPTFHARYEAMPPETRAELIDGVVRMSSPMRDSHGDTTSDIAGWLFHYKRFTRGLRGGEGTTTILGDFAEPQPECILYIPEALGGLSRIDADGYLVGPPELV